MLQRASTSSLPVSNLAERVGFEPTVHCCTHDFQSCTFGHSVTSPGAFRSAARPFSSAFIGYPGRSFKTRPLREGGSRSIFVLGSSTSDHLRGQFVVVASLDVQLTRAAADLTIDGHLPNIVDGDKQAELFEAPRTGHGDVAMHDGRKKLEPSQPLCQAGPGSEADPSPCHATSANFFTGWRRAGHL